MRVLFPRDYFSHKKPDEMFQDQFEAFKEAGYNCSVIDVDSLAAGAGTTPDLSGERVLYRGWMLDLATYENLCKAIVAGGGSPFVNPEQYRTCHHLPGWYWDIRDLTPETVVLERDDDLRAALRALDWGRFFIKDYVKSLKTGTGSIITSADQIDAVVAEMEKFRGEVEGGICVRRVEDFVPETERRYFVINGVPYSPECDDSIPCVVLACAQRVASPFFSVDVIETTDGEQRVVEIGDGQVSDLVGWTAERFVQVWEENR